MARPRCAEPGCGRFVGAGADRCARHDAAAPGEGPREEIDALRRVLRRLMNEVEDVEALARHVPRVSSVAIQAMREARQQGARNHPDVVSLLADLEEAEGHLNALSGLTV